MLELKVADLLLLPGAVPFMQGSGTEVLLPDGESTMTIGGYSDERWRSFNGTTIALFVHLSGPAARLDAREFFALMPGTAYYRHCTDSDRSREIGFHHHTVLHVVKAMEHTCGARPGRPCDRPWRHRRCTTPSKWPVDVTAAPEGVIA